MTDESHPHDPAPGAPQPPASELAPLPVPTRRIVEIGILGWVVALVVVLLVPALHEGDRDWWPWTCVAGIGLGGIGWAYLRRGRGNAKDAG